MVLKTHKGALFSNCTNYRFLLWRNWNNTLPKILFIGLNPSTANASTNDATTKKVVAWSKLHGFGGVVLGNCFPFITTHPKNLSNFSHLDINDAWLLRIRNQVAQVVFAWGNFEMVVKKERHITMQRLFPKAKILAFNKNGSPKHPLYIPLDTALKPYTNPIPFQTHAK